MQFHHFEHATSARLPGITRLKWMKAALMIGLIYLHAIPSLTQAERNPALFFNTSVTFLNTFCLVAPFFIVVTSLWLC